MCRYILPAHQVKQSLIKETFIRNFKINLFIKIEEVSVDQNLTLLPYSSANNSYESVTYCMNEFENSFCEKTHLWENHWNFWSSG